MSRFKAHYQTIKESPHFDEFLFLSDKPGLFVTRCGFIATHFAHFLQAGFLDMLNESQQSFVQQVQQDFASTAKSQNTLPHHNEQVLTEINLDLLPISSNALQALYEDINLYQDPKNKEACLAQLKQERPLLDPINTNNLVRTINFYNMQTRTRDTWFTPDSYSSNAGLGFSFAILRGTRQVAGGWAGVEGVASAVEGGEYALVDLAAIEAIDEARTVDLKQSLANLNALSFGNLPIFN